MKKFNIIYEETIVETQLNNLITEGITENLFNFLKNKLNAILTSSADTAIGICKAITNYPLFKKFDIYINKEKLKNLIIINEDKTENITIDDEKFKQFVIQTLNENNEKIEKINKERKHEKIWNFVKPILFFIIKVLVIAGIILAIYFLCGNAIDKIWDIIKIVLFNISNGTKEVAEIYSAPNSEVTANIEKLPPLAGVLTLDQMNGTGMLRTTILNKTKNKTHITNLLCGFFIFKQSN